MMSRKIKYTAIILAFVLAGSFCNLYAAEIGKEAVSFKSQQDKWGLGLQGGVGGAAILPNTGLIAGFPDGWLAITLHVPQTSFILSVGVAGLGFDGYGVNANIDFLLAAVSPVRWFELHLFLGAGATVYGYTDGIGLSVGARLPLGMSFWLWSWFQISLEATPIVGLGVALGDPSHFWIHLDVPIDLGVRFWF